jgi:hypothetical protein
MRGSRRRIRLANGWPNLRAHCRTVSWLTMMPLGRQRHATIRVRFCEGVPSNGIATAIGASDLGWIGPFLTCGLIGGDRFYAQRPRHLIATTARPFLPHPRHRNRPFKSRTLIAGFNPTRNSASGGSSATEWQAAQSTFTKSPDPRSSIRAAELSHPPVCGF